MRIGSQTRLENQRLTFAKWVRKRDKNGYHPKCCPLVLLRPPYAGCLLRGRFVGEEKTCTRLYLLVHGNVQGMDRFSPFADVLIARFVVCEIGEFYRDIMCEIWETAVEVPEHFPLLHAPTEHVSF